MRCVVFAVMMVCGAWTSGHCTVTDAGHAKALFLQGIGIETEIPGFTYRFLQEVDPSFFLYYNQFYYKFPVFRGERDEGKVPGSVPLEYPSNPLVKERQSLDRFPDVIGIEGEFLQELLGEKISLIGVFAFRNEVEKFTPIPFQFDELTEDGRWVLDAGPKANSKEGNGILDTQDVLSFMARDAGDRVSQDAWPKAYKKAIEMKIIDPLNQKTGWVYLFSFSDAPEYSPIRYVIYTHGVPDAMWALGWSQLHWFAVSYKDGHVGRAWGGNGKNILDTLLVNGCFKMFFKALRVCLDLNKIRSDTPTYQLGPVLLHRRTYNYIPLGMGLKSPSLVSDGWYGDGYCHAPLLVKIPFKLDTIFSSVKLEAGTDYNTNIYGSIVTTSTNPEGFMVDGIMSPQEKDFVRGVKDPNREWRLMSGPGGAILTRNMHDPEMVKHARFDLNYLDDFTVPREKTENYEGRIGYSSQIWDLTDVPKGTYISYTEYYTIPHYRPGEEIDYLNIFDNPLELQILDRTRKNKTNRRPPGGD